MNVHIYTVIVLHFALMVYGQSPIVQIVQTDPQYTESLDGKLVVAYRDNDVLLTCIVQNRPVASQVKWRRIYFADGGKRHTEEVSESQGVFDNTRYGIEKQSNLEWRLRIKNIPKDLVGTFQCYVEINSLDDKHDSVTILVVQAPVLLPQATSTDTVALEGTPIDLTCDATGIPKPTIEWSRQGSKLLPTGKEKFVGTKLTIPSVKADNRGYYRCSAYNDAGTLTTDIFLEVQFHPVMTPIHSQLSQAVGYVIELQCIVQSNPAPLSSNGDYAMKWVHNQRSYTQSTGRYKFDVQVMAFKSYILELVINGVTDTDYGDWQCQAMNNLVTDWSIEHIQLTKAGTPQQSTKIGKVLLAGSPGQPWMYLWVIVLFVYFM